MPRTLARTVTKTEAGGKALVSPLKAFNSLEVSIREQEVTMIAGQPGAGKSSLALHVGLATQVPTLYFAADTSPWTMAIRTISMLTGYRQTEVERRMLANSEWGQAYLEAQDHIQWVWDSNPDMQIIDEELNAYLEVYGAFPKLIIIDNLIDIADGSGDEWSVLRNCIKDLKAMARATGAAIVLLHHTSEGFKQDDYCVPPRAALQGKVAQIPAVILTVHSNGGTMFIGAVKNRFGKADASGRTVAEIWFDGATMQIKDKERLYDQ